MGIPDAGAALRIVGYDRVRAATGVSEAGDSGLRLLEYCWVGEA